MSAHYQDEESSLDSTEGSEGSVGSQSQETTTSESSNDSHDGVEESVWQRIQTEAIERHENNWQHLVDNYEQAGENAETAKIKASNDLVPTYRKELRAVLFEYLKWMHGLKKNAEYRKVMETKQNLMDTEGFGWEEATEAAINQRKFLLNKLFYKQPILEHNANPVYKL